ncbi:MAG: 3-hydroxyisobutyrate dehydrogenase [Verrucomicrobia bacterium]|nr:MAG: 3-hydroxyisobutyrate dehydrogenase [Verrucomicrobiota bacterium]
MRLTSKDLGFVGVGRMGANMARHLSENGYHVAAVFDPKLEAAQALATEIGATACSSLAEVSRLAKTIFTVVTDDKAQLQIFANRKDNLLKSAPGRTFVNCATVAPETHQKVARLCHAAGAASLEACMASSITQARNGTLYLMCGGEKRVFLKLKPVLEALSDHGKLLRYIGETGRAAQLKALVNMVMNINTAALAEGLALGDALGQDLSVVREVFSQTGAASRVLATDGDDMVNRDHACFFSGAHAAKDSAIALALAKTQKLHLPLAQATLAQFERLVAAGLGGLDKSGIAELTFRGRGPAPSKPKRPSQKSQPARASKKH